MRAADLLLQLLVVGYIARDPALGVGGTLKIAASLLVICVVPPCLNSLPQLVEAAFLFLDIVRLGARCFRSGCRVH